MILDYQIGVILKQVPSSPISSGAHIHKQVTPHAIAENTIAFFLSVVGDFCVSKKNQKPKKKLLPFVVQKQLLLPCYLPKSQRYILTVFWTAARNFILALQSASKVLIRVI